MGKTKNKKEEKEATEGSAVNVHYRGTLSDGTIFDSSYDRGEAISFTVGAGEMIPGFDAAINGMTIGEKKTINLTSEESYGPHNPDAIREVPKASFPDDFNFLEGHAVEGSAGGRPLRARIASCCPRGSFVRACLLELADLRYKLATRALTLPAHNSINQNQNTMK